MSWANHPALHAVMAMVGLMCVAYLSNLTPISVGEQLILTVAGVSFVFQLIAALLQVSGAG